MMASKEYNDYIKSEDWAALKCRKRAVSTKRCGICAATSKIDCHHLVYKSLYDVETSDLRWLCRRCHSKAHALMRNGTIRFKSSDHNSRWNTTKNCVKHSLGLTGKNMFP